MTSRLLMARAPEGAVLVDNPTGGPKGLPWKTSTYSPAFLWSCRQCSSLEGKLKSGPVVRSCSIRAYLGESQISHVLGEIQAQNSSVDIGSYPFFKEDRYGTTLVIRGTDEQSIEDAAKEIMSAVSAAGEEPEDLGTEG